MPKTANIKKTKPAKRVKRKPARRGTVSEAAKRRQRAKRLPSSLELNIYAMLDELGIAYLKEHKISRCTVDILIPPHQVIEIQGCYFHRHTCMPSKPGNIRKDAAIRCADERRFYVLRKAGYSVALVWGCQVEKDPKQVKEFLRQLGGK